MKPIALGLSLVDPLVKFILAIWLVSSPLLAVDLEFHQGFDDGSYSKLEHYNTREKKITGFSTLEYRFSQQKGKKYILEINRNMKPDGEVFSEKRAWFQLPERKLVHYEETDHRSGLKVTNEYSFRRINTTAQGKEGKLEFSVDIEDDLVPFEVISLHLKREMPNLLRGVTRQMTLYLPMLALELEKKGLPLSFSKIGMEITPLGPEEVTTKLGSFSGFHLVVRPSNMVLASMLPKEKREFHFIFQDKPPYQLLVFEENETRSRLIEERRP